jgi:hypothetical protein
MRPTGDPVVFMRAPTTYDFFRFNRIEGLYLGVAGTLFMRDKLPGLALRAGVGLRFLERRSEGRTRGHPAPRPVAGGSDR